LGAADSDIEGKKKLCLPFFLARDGSLRAQLLDPLYAVAKAGLFEMKGMTVANVELGAGNERERQGDCFADGLSAIPRMAKTWIEGRKVSEREREAGLRHPFFSLKTPRGRLPGRPRPKGQGDPYTLVGILARENTAWSWENL
jgi:hypothetical protein